MVMTEPFGPGPTSPQRATFTTFESLNTDVYSETASSALSSNHRKVVIFGLAMGRFYFETRPKRTFVSMNPPLSRPNQP